MFTHTPKQTHCTNIHFQQCKQGCLPLGRLHFVFSSSLALFCLQPLNHGAFFLPEQLSRLTAGIGSLAATEIPAADHKSFFKLALASGLFLRADQSGLTRDLQPTPAES